MNKREVKKLNLGFNIGDKVAVDNDKVYYAYVSFVDKHRKYAARWQYKRFINSDGFPLTVVGVYEHVDEDRYDKNKYCVVVKDKFNRIYLVGERGVVKHDTNKDIKFETGTINLYHQGLV